MGWQWKCDRWTDQKGPGSIKVPILKTMVLGISIPVSQKIGDTPCLIPTVIDQNPCAHLRMPRDMIFHGWSMRLFQAWQHSATCLRRMRRFDNQLSRMNCQHSIPVEVGHRGGRPTVMLHRQRVWPCLTTKHRWAPGSRRLISMSCAAMASVRKMTSPAPFPFAGRSPEDIGPRCAGRGAPARACQAAQRVNSSADAGFILPPQLYLDAFREPRPDLRQFGASTASSFCASGAAARDLGEAERLQLAPDRGLVERDGERLQSHRARSRAPAHDAVDRRDLPASTNPPVRGGDRR